MRQPRKPDPEVMESDYRIPTALGTAAWTLALIVLLTLDDHLPEADRWWRWVCATGIAFGVFAFFYIPRHLRNQAARDRREDAATHSTATEDGQADSDAAGAHGRTSGADRRDAAAESGDRSPGGDSRGSTPAPGGPGAT